MSLSSKAGKCRSPPCQAAVDDINIGGDAVLFATYLPTSGNVHPG